MILGRGSIEEYNVSFFARFSSWNTMVTHSMDNILNMQYYPTNSQVDAVPQSSPLRKRRCLNKEVIFLFFRLIDFSLKIEIEIERRDTT